MRCFALEVDNEFVYLALERCKHSLHDKFNRPGQGTVDEFVDDAKWPTAFCLDVRAFPYSSPLALVHASVSCACTHTNIKLKWMDGCWEGQSFNLVVSLWTTCEAEVLQRNLVCGCEGRRRWGSGVGGI